jgi:hypothetical protein
MKIVNSISIGTILVAVLSHCGGNSGKTTSSPVLTGPKVAEEVGSGDAEATPPVTHEPAVTIFEDTVYPLLRTNCATCHSEVRPQGPEFAASDVEVAYRVIFEAQKINVAYPEKSRISVKVAEGHNCWHECAEDASALNTAVKEFLAAAKLEAPPETDKVTAQLTLSGAVGENQMIADGRTFIVEAETAQLSGLMIKNNDPLQASGGEFIYTMKNAALVNNLMGTPTGDATATFTFNLTNAGTYFLWVKGRGIDDTSDSVFLRVNGALAATGGMAPGVWNALRTNGNAFAWIQAPVQLNLAPGPNTITFERRELGTELDMVALTLEPTFTGEAVGPISTTKSLTFDLESILGTPGAKFLIDIVEQTEDSYKVFNARITIADRKIRVKAPKILVNGAYQPHHNAFNSVDLEISAPGGPVSDQTMIVVRELQAPAEDKFSFTFEELVLTD